MAAALPLGLQQLVHLDSVKVKQRRTAFANKYVVSTAAGESIFTAREDASAVEVMVGGTNRGFHVDLYDANQQQVITLRRPFSLGDSKMQVMVAGEAASVVRQQATFFKPVLSINDAREHPVLRVKGPVAPLPHTDVQYDLLALDKSRIGSIQKKWNGVCREHDAEVEQFHVRFPAELDVRYKAAVIGTCIFIDFLYYEKNS